jgi:hypothetical protein
MTWRHQRENMKMRAEQTRSTTRYLFAAHRAGSGGDAYRRRGSKRAALAWRNSGGRESW